MQTKGQFLSVLILIIPFIIPWQACPQSPTAWINEFHYDNVGTDQDEFIEIVVEGPQYNRSSWSLVLYNGGTGTAYNTLTDLSLAQEGDTVLGRRFFVFNLPVNGLQNGSPDGIVLCFVDSQATTQVIDAISYEGSFTPIAGPATGILLPDILQSESNTTTPIGFSLQLLDDNPSSTWLPAATNSRGQSNYNPSLPVILLSADLEEHDGNVDLVWSTASEVNSSHFNIQQSHDGTNVQNIGFQYAQGFSSTISNYRMDLGHLEPKTMIRLESVDLDGRIEFSDWEIFEVSVDEPWSLSIHGNSLVIEYDGCFEVGLTSILGRSSHIGSCCQSLTLPQPLPGIYTATIRSEGFEDSRTFVILP